MDGIELIKKLIKKRKVKKLNL